MVRGFRAALYTPKFGSVCFHSVFQNLTRELTDLIPSEYERKFPSREFAKP